MSTARPPARRPGRVPNAALASHDAALVDTAAALIREHGYAHVSIDMIARGAAVSPKTIYARYGGKLGLFEAVIERMVAKPIGVWETLDPDRPPEIVLTEAADRFLVVVLSPEVLAIERAIIAEGPRLPGLAKTFYARGPLRGLKALAAYFAVQTERGLLCVANPPAAAEAFIGLIEGELVRRAFFLGEEPDIEDRRRWASYAVELFVVANRNRSRG